jgi:transcriptional regulator with XRE-family HTH domain
MQTSRQTLGADLRALRKARGITLIALAAKLDKSVGWLSQVERDISTPTPADLDQFASALDITRASLSQTDADPADDGIIVRANARRPMRKGTKGLTEGLLSPDLTDSFEVIHSRFEVGSRLPTPLQRQTQEIGYVISGQLDIWVDDVHFTLSEGDSFRLRGETYHWENRGTIPCEMIWVVSPPVY